MLKSTQGKDGGLGWSNGSGLQRGVWNKIVGTINRLHDSGVIQRNSFKMRVGDGAFTLFWKDHSTGQCPLMIRFPRLFLLERNKDCNISERWNGQNMIWNWIKPIKGGTSFTHMQLTIYNS